MRKHAYKAIIAVLELREVLAAEIAESCRESDMSGVTEDPYEPCNKIDEFVAWLKTMV
jgi:hypothetical protein